MNHPADGRADLDFAAHVLPGLRHEVHEAPRKPPKARGPGASARREWDFYPTPAWMTDHLLDRLKLDLWNGPPSWAARLGTPVPPYILEPCAGQGNITNAILRRHPSAQVTSWDIDPQWGHEIRDATQAANWLDVTDPRPDWVITNPPFNQAFDIIRLAVQTARLGVAALLRVTWLEPLRSPEGRAKAYWLEANPPQQELIMERWSFDGSGKQDSATSAWFIWSPYYKPVKPIEIIVGRGRQEGLDL